jgi:solute carrier family 35 protein
MWFVVFAFDQVYIKHVCDTVPMTSWGRVYYTNLLSVIPITLVGLSFGEHNMIADFVWTAPSVWALLLSCLCGVGMSYSAFWLRSLVRRPSFLPPSPLFSGAQTSQPSPMRPGDANLVECHILLRLTML